MHTSSLGPLWPRAMGDTYPATLMCYPVMLTEYVSSSKYVASLLVGSDSQRELGLVAFSAMPSAPSGDASSRQPGCSSPLKHCSLECSTIIQPPLAGSNVWPECLLHFTDLSTIHDHLNVALVVLKHLSPILRSLRHLQTAGIPFMSFIPRRFAHHIAHNTGADAI